MIRASVASPIIGTGAGAPADLSNSFRARLIDIPGVISFSDDTGANPPVAPNACVFICVFTDEAFALVDADPAYYVNWSEVVI